MSDAYDGQPLKIWSPARYHIEVEGMVGKSGSDHFGNMRITTREREDNSIITIMVGRVRDQAELSGLLNRLYENHLPILSVELLEDEEDNPKA